MPLERNQYKVSDSNRSNNMKFEFETNGEEDNENNSVIENILESECIDLGIMKYASVKNWKNYVFLYKKNNKPSKI